MSGTTRCSRLQTECLKEVKQELYQRDNEILCLRKEMEDLSQTLTKTTNQLWTRDAEFLQSEKAWEEEYNLLEEKFKKELATSQTGGGREE